MPTMLMLKKPNNLSPFLFLLLTADLNKLNPLVYSCRFNKPMVELKKLICPVHCRFFSDISPLPLPTDDLKKLISPVPVLGIEKIISLEVMLSRRVLVFDFDTALVKTERLTKSGRLSAVGKALLDYEDIFKGLLGDSKNTCLKLKFCLFRLKLNTFLVERLLRDYLNRCKLHIALLSHERTKDSVKVTYYMKQSDLLLKELDDFLVKKVEVFDYVDSSFNSYRVDSKCDLGLYALEKDLYKLRDKCEFKRLTESLAKYMSELRDCRLASLPSTSTTITIAGFGLIITEPWYESESVLALACGVIFVCTCYFIMKDKDDNDGSGGLTSGIEPSKGFIDLLPPKENLSTWDWFLDFYMNVRFMSGRFAANPGFGKSSYCLLGSGFSLFAGTFADYLCDYCPNRLRRIVFWYDYFLLIACIYFWLCSCLCISKSQGTFIRKYLLLTFSHLEFTPERRELTVETFISRLTGLFACKSIIVCKESHVSRGGLHYHVGVWNENASKNTLVSKLRNAFPEFEGRQMHISPHKGWNTVCRYLLKEDPNPTVWGEESLELVKDRAKSADYKIRGPDLVKLLREK